MRFTLLALALCVLSACDGSTTMPEVRKPAAPSHTMVGNPAVLTLSVPDTIVADSATGNCDLPLTYSLVTGHSAYFDSSSVRVAGHEFPLNAARMASFMGASMVPGMAHTGVLLDSTLPAHYPAPYPGNFILYFYLDGVRYSGFVEYMCIAARHPDTRTPPNGDGSILP